MTTIQKARKLRKNQTDAEQLLWSKLRSKQVAGQKFRRQHPIGKYIVDFVCLEKKIIVKLDGSEHSDSIHYDEDRTSFLQAEGYEVLRFWNNEVFEETDAVIQVIYNKVMER